MPKYDAFEATWDLAMSALGDFRDVEEILEEDLGRRLTRAERKEAYRAYQALYEAVGLVLENRSL